SSRPPPASPGSSGRRALGSSLGAAVSCHGAHGAPSPRTVSTVRPAGTAVPGSEILIDESSRSASSASASRSFASAMRASATSPLSPRARRRGAWGAAGAARGTGARGGARAPPPPPPPLLALCPAQAALPPPHVRLSRGDRAQRRHPLGREHRLVRLQVPAVH